MFNLYIGGGFLAVLKLSEQNTLLASLNFIYEEWVLQEGRVENKYNE